MSEYDHAGEWECEACGETFEVETKLDPLAHALGCGSDTGTTGPRTRSDGYWRRKRELREMEADRE